MHLMKANHGLIGIIWTGLRLLSRRNQPVGRCAAEFCSLLNVSDLQQEQTSSSEVGWSKTRLLKALSSSGTSGIMDLHRSQL